MRHTLFRWWLWRGCFIFFGEYGLVNNIVRALVGLGQAFFKASMFRRFLFLVATGKILDEFNHLFSGSCWG